MITHLLVPSARLATVYRPTGLPKLVAGPDVWKLYQGR